MKPPPLFCGAVPRKTLGIGFYRCDDYLRQHVYSSAKVFMTETLLNPIKNQCGSATVEFALMLPFMVCIMVFLLLTYEFIDQMIQCEQKNWYALRYKIDTESFGRLHSVEKRSLSEVEVPGIMKDVLGAASLRREHALRGCTGSYREPGSPDRGRFPNRYRNGGYTSSRDDVLKIIQ